MQRSKQSACQMHRQWRSTIPSAPRPTTQTVSIHNRLRLAPPGEAQRVRLTSSRFPSALRLCRQRPAVFSCYQYVTESHCSSTTPVPYGVCNRNGPDTSRTVQQATSSAATSHPGTAWRWAAVVTATLACAAIQSMVSLMWCPSMLAEILADSLIHPPLVLPFALYSRPSSHESFRQTMTSVMIPRRLDTRPRGTKWTINL